MAEYSKIDPADAQAGDVMTYVHPELREVRSHRIQRRDVRKLGRHVVVYRGGKPVVKQQDPELRAVFLPRLHDHEMTSKNIDELLVWVPIEDALAAWRQHG
jgi:hypothetical protein